MNNKAQKNMHVLDIKPDEVINITPGTAAMYDINPDNRHGRMFPVYGKKQIKFKVEQIKGPGRITFIGAGHKGFLDLNLVPSSPLYLHRSPLLYFSDSLRLTYRVKDIFAVPGWYCTRIEGSGRIGLVAESAIMKVSMTVSDPPLYIDPASLVGYQGDFLVKRRTVSSNLSDIFKLPESLSISLESGSGYFFLAAPPQMGHAKQQNGSILEIAEQVPPFGWTIGIARRAKSLIS